MEKVNVYDWDKTIFPVDSTVASCAGACGGTPA